MNELTDFQRQCIQDAELIRADEHPPATHAYQRQACPTCTRLYLAWANTPREYRAAADAAKWAYQAHRHECENGLGKGAK